MEIRVSSSMIHLRYLHMYSNAIRQLSPSEFPPLLSEIPDPPAQLWAAGNLPPPTMKLLAVVGSRNHTSYATHVIEHLISGLAQYNIGIISGLAIGIDTLAHEAALKHKLYTLSVPGSGLDTTVLYPARNKRLAARILENGGGLLSELPPTTPAAQWTFPARNRIMAGMTHATLLIEAGEKSGTLITARLAVDYNRELLVVPGNIFSATSFGNHQFLKLGATAITTATDILDALNIEVKNSTESLTQPLPLLSPVEQKIVNALTEPLSRDALIRRSELATSTAVTVLMKLELEGIIRAENGIYVRTTI